MQKKKDILTRAISTGVLTNKFFFFFLCFCKFCIFAENTTKIGVSAPPPPQRKKKHKKKNKNHCVKNWSKYVAQHNWTNS